MPEKGQGELTKIMLFNKIRYNGIEYILCNINNCIAILGLVEGCYERFNKSINVVCHVSSKGRALAFRADRPGFIPGPT